MINNRINILNININNMISYMNNKINIQINNIIINNNLYIQIMDIKIKHINII